MKVKGILESSLYVADLKISGDFYRDIFEFETLFCDERLCALKVCDTQVLLLFKIGASLKGEPTPGGVIPPHDGHGQLHLAFHVEKQEMGAWREKLQMKGIPIESEVRINNGYSIYFRDPDNHGLELTCPELWILQKEK